MTALGGDTSAYEIGHIKHLSGQRGDNLAVFILGEGA